MDDGASADILRDANSEVFKAIKTCRHLHLTTATCVQTVTDAILKLKRLVYDSIIYKGLSKNDIENTLEKLYLPPGISSEMLIPIYQKLQGKHSKMIIYKLSELSPIEVIDN
jgi:hypothetical protein